MTMFKTKEEIEEMANRWSKSDMHPMSERNDDYSISFYGRVKGYKAGYTQSQQDIKEACSEGFDECFSKYATESNLHHEFDAHYFWQAAKLDSMKELQEKDDEIERLKNFPLNGIVCECITDCGCILKLKEMFQEAVRDIDWLLNKEYSIVRVKLSSKKETMTCMKHLVEDQDKVQEIKNKYGLDKKEG